MLAQALGSSSDVFKCREKVLSSSHTLQIGSGADLIVPRWTSLLRKWKTEFGKLEVKRQRGELLTCIVSRVSMK